MRALLLAALLLPGCKKRAVAVEVAPDARPAEILTPGGRVSPEAIQQQVTDTLEKEHQRTLDPKVE
jgi:hypothetical protein